MQFAMIYPHSQSEFDVTFTYCSVFTEPEISLTRFQIWNNPVEILEHSSKHTKTPQLKFLSAILINFSGTLRIIIMIFYLFCDKFWNRHYKSLAHFFLLQISLTMSESRSLVVLYGSQTGTAQEVAERVGRSVVSAVLTVTLRKNGCCDYDGLGTGRQRGFTSPPRSPPWTSSRSRGCPPRPWWSTWSPPPVRGRSPTIWRKHGGQQNLLRLVMI